MTAEEELMKATRQLENVLRNYTGGLALGLLYTIRSSAAALFAEGYTKAQQDIDVDLDAAYDEGYLAASCDRDHAIMEDLHNLAAKYSWG